MGRDGILNLHKPGGVTSRDVVDQVQRLARPAKVGHAGTLDPLATGVLVVCVGAATRLIRYVQKMPKSYVGTFLLGRQSPTEDIEGEVTELPSAPIPTREQLVDAAKRLVGSIQQRPPAYSALKVEGQRAYHLARQGARVDLKPRTVEIHRLEVRGYEYPRLELEVECGSGTYIRSLGRDLAESLGTAAVMQALVRSGIGGFRLEAAVDPNQLTQEHWAEHLLPLVRAVEGMAQLRLSSAERARIRQGMAIARALPRGSGEEVAAVDSEGRLVAILAGRGRGMLGPVRNLPTERA